MRKISLALLICFISALAPQLVLAAGEGLLPTHPLDQKNDPALGAILDVLGLDQGVSAKDGIYYTVNIGPNEPLVNVVPLKKASEPGQTTYMFYQEVTGKIFFLKVGLNSGGKPEIRLWSQGDGELIFSEEVVGYHPGRSAQTFRIPDGENFGISSVTEAITCLATVLGISITGGTSSYYTLVQLLASIYCSMNNLMQTLSAIQTACNCASTLSIGTGAIFGTLGCVQGLSQLILCSIISCDGGDGGGCQSGTIAVSNGFWISGSVSRSGQNKYCLDLSSWYSVDQIVVELDVTSGDPDLYTNHDGSMPSTSDYDCRPYSGSGTDERCTMVSPQVGPNYFMVRGYSAATYRVKATAD